ncbi:hypothetical protein Nepgr_022014 [Nepenthes gracilis]|uniref:Uncharacterized protein n=1 Tax=Nepenthes gracilis TaxID=150966 RepID=A0AAD3XWK3_NEPGR|nr:hypothetical protein Nepgr_022014 [Nepenthes gracilis]
MAESAQPRDDLKELLKPFYQRASEAEDRLSRLEAALPNKKDDVISEECSKMVRELQLKLEEITAELASEQAKVAKLTAENAKKDYRISHLVRSLEEIDLKAKP